MRPVLGIGTAGLLAVLTLTACSEDRPSAEDVAGEVAAGLESGKFPESAFEGSSPQSAYDEIVAGLGEDTEPTVEVKDVTEGAQTAEATLAWRWDLDGHAWEYSTTLDLSDDGKAWRAQWAPTVVEPSLEDGEALQLSTVQARRGDIVGAGGSRLVTGRPVVRFGIDKTKVSDRRAALSARDAAQLLGIGVAAYVKAVRAAGDMAFVEAIVLRPDDAGEVPGTYDAIPGAVRLRGRLPLAPTREFAAAVLGRVGPVTAEMVEQSDGRLQAGDVAGLSGLEARYDEELAGKPGLEVEAVNEEHRTRPLFRVPPVDGKPLRITLDEALQTKAERALAPMTDVPAALVAIRPSTGALLAIANGAGTDGQNIATYGQYAPGSTFKVVSSLALLRSGVGPDDTVQCPATTVVDGKEFKNYGDYPSGHLGDITLREAVAYSCNTAFITARTKLSRGALSSAAASLGLGVDQDLGFPAYFGQVPPAATETELAADMIGQGKVLASPMTMATVAASVQSGRTVVPYLIPSYKPSASPDEPLEPGEAATLASLMRAVVSEGSGSLLAGLPGDVGAKTGTAEYGEPGPGGALPTHTWMIAFQDDLAVAVFVETGESGSSTAGPILKAFLS